MSEISSQLSRWSDAVSELEVQVKTVENQYVNIRQRRINNKKKLESIEQSQLIAQTVAQNIQEQVHAKIGSVVTRCLMSVFPDPYQFKILFERKRNRTEANLIFEREGHEISPLTASGGGVVDLAAFALRLSTMMLQRPKLRRTIVMDEPFKSPSPHYRQQVNQLMSILSGEMGVQFIMVTNIMELVTGEVIDLDT